MIDFVLENSRHQPIKKLIILFTLDVLKQSSDLVWSLHQNHLFIVTDTSFPSQALILRIAYNAWIYDCLESFVLPGRIPIFLLTDHKQRYLWLSYLGRSNAHSFTLPEACRVSETIFAQIDSIQHFFVADRELSDSLEASLMQNLMTFFKDWVKTFYKLAHSVSR